MSKYMSDALVFVSYAHADQDWLERFRLALSKTRENAEFRIWTDHAIEPGNNWHPKILNKLDKADIILFLITPALLVSEFISRQEIRRAIARHNQNLARVIPILIEDCNWKETPFANIQGLPKGMIPIASMADPDYSLQKIIEEIGTLAQVIKPGVLAYYDSELEDFTDAQLMGLMQSIRTNIRVIEETIIPIPEAYRPAHRLIELEELRQRLQSYENEFQRR